MTAEKETRDNIYNLMEKINKDLNEFITKRIQTGIVSDKNWSSLFNEPEKEWCWETMHCKKEDCPARKQDDYRCWLIAGTLCGGIAQGTFAKKYGTCITCEVYKQYLRKPIRALYENISVLISHISDEACEFHREARTDPLTKLLSRKSFNEVIDQEVKRSKRMNGTRLTLVVFDLDHFKEINDDGGHLVGDFYLVEFARLLRCVTRETDYIFRTGGDEFIILLVGGKKEEMLVYINRVQGAIADWNANKERPYSYTMAVSAGGACLNDFEYNIDKCIVKADERMYQNKQERKAGR